MVAGSRLTVESVIRMKNHKTKAVCLCACGNRKTLILAQVRSGAVRSCGCLKREVSSEHGKMNRKHGGASARSPEYRSWESMKARCMNKNDPVFPHYGGRGIRVHAEWAVSFESFLRDMGARPRGTTLDRIDVNGDYAPENCRWADPVTQGRNKRNNQVVEYQGRVVTLMELSEMTGQPYQRLNERIVRRGWDVDRAVNEPPRVNPRWAAA